MSWRHLGTAVRVAIVSLRSSEIKMMFWCESKQTWSEDRGLTDRFEIGDEDLVYSVVEVHVEN